MTYKPNPKTEGSGIITAIPQEGPCPVKCDECFFQKGRSYLEPLSENLPNMPEALESVNRIVRVNDGNDSNNYPEFVRRETSIYEQKFYNTSIVHKLFDFDAPFVLTINPGDSTDKHFHKLEINEIPKTLMFVRFRVNTWNLYLFKDAVYYYSRLEIPTVATFMAYHDQENIPQRHRIYYIWRQRTINDYYAIRSTKYHEIMDHFRNTDQEKWVHSCGKEGITTQCRFCGNCLREYFATKERMRKNDTRN